MLSDLQLPTLTRDDLRPGDVLLCHSQGAMAELVAKGGQGSYSHAALFCGVGDNVIESVPGPEHRSPGQVRETAIATFAVNRAVVHVYRLKTAAQHPEFLHDVVHRARHYIGHAYGITQVLLNAYAMQRALQEGKPLTEEQRREAAQFVHDLREAERLPERIGITCSELVCQAFADARGPDGASRPLRCGPARPERTREALPLAGRYVADSLEAELLRLTERLTRAQGRLRGETAYRADGDDRAADWPIYMVSPGDLEHCPDLAAVGELSQEACTRMTLHVPVAPPAGAPRAPCRTSSVPLGIAPTVLAAPVRVTAPIAGAIAARPSPVQTAEVRSLPASACRARIRGALVYVSATPAEFETIAVTDEINAIKDTIHRSRLRMADQVTGATVSMTAQAIEREEPHVLHFACHGSPEGLVLVNRHGGPNRLSGATIISILRSTRHKPQLVLLNACRSAGLAEHLAPLVDHVIAMEGPISDREAIGFAATFYKCLGDDKSIGTAFDLARHELGDSEARPVLLASRQRASRRRNRQVALTGMGMAAVVGLVAIAAGTLVGAPAQGNTQPAAPANTASPAGVSEAAAPPLETTPEGSRTRLPQSERTKTAPLPAVAASEGPRKQEEPSAREPASARPVPTFSPEAPRKQQRRASAPKRYGNADALKAAKRAGRIDEQAYRRELARLKTIRDSALYGVRAEFNQGLLDRAAYEERVKAIHAAYLGHEPGQR